MAKIFKAGLVQMCSGRTVGPNLDEACRLIREARSQGADYILTPETTNIMELERAKLLAATAPEDGNVAVERFSDLARELRTWLHIGSVIVHLKNSEKTANRSMLFSPDGEIVARYDKIHMFDVDLPGGETYRESNSYEPGLKGVVTNLPWGTLGMTICYDLRFPYLYRALAKAGAKFLTVPAAFTVPTGTVHWHALLKARAIECQCFVFAAAQGGAHENGRSTYGHSLVVSPWGEVLAEGDADTPSVIMADIDLDVLDTARTRVPSLQHDRPFEVELQGELVDG